MTNKRTLNLHPHPPKLNSVIIYHFIHFIIVIIVILYCYSVIIYRYSQSLKPCELQKPIPNHQSSFCWICLPLLTLSIIRSSRPLSSSLDITGIPLLWFESYLTGRSFKGPGEGRYPKHINWSLGFPRDRVLGPLLFSTYTTSLGPIIQAHGFSLPFLH